MQKAALALAGCVGLIACSPMAVGQEGAVAPAGEAASQTAATMPATHAESGLRLIEVAVLSGGQRHAFATEVAASNQEQGRGLMFRTQLGDAEAMIFPSGTPQFRSFWMKNTPLPLDIIFIGEDRRILNIEAGVPYSLDSVFSDGPALAVLEVRGGLCAELGIKPGDQVEWVLPQ